MVKVIITVLTLTILLGVIVVLSSSGFKFGSKGEENLVGSDAKIRSTESILIKQANVTDDTNITEAIGSEPLQNEHQKSLLGLANTKVEIDHIRGREQASLRCGQPIITFDQRITGGKEASIGEFPWIVSLQRERQFWFGFRTFFHSCGGSLITPSWIVTAAHCLYNKEPMARAVAGADNMNFLYRAQLRSVSKTIIHPGFDSATFNDDIALIKVNHPFNLESTFSHVGAICLDRDVMVEPYDIATIAGFGANSYSQHSQAHLYKTEIAIIDERTCNESFNHRITQNMICAGGMIQRKRDACAGDSGGPLELDVDDHISLVGIISFGNKCATEGYPGVYTRLSNYYDWLLTQIDEPLINP